MVVPQQLCRQLVCLLNDLQSASSSDLQNLRDPLNQLSIQLNQISTQLNQRLQANNQWRDLPAKILETIYKRLNTRTDFNHMSAVCKPWRTSLTSLKPLCPTKFAAHLTCLADDFTIPQWSCRPDEGSSLKFQFAQCVFHLVSHRRHDNIEIVCLAKNSNSSTMIIDFDPDHTHGHINNLFRPHQESNHGLNSLNYRIVEACRSYYLETTCMPYYQRVVIPKIVSLRETAAKEAEFVLLGLSTERTLAWWNTMTRNWCEVKKYKGERRFVDVISFRNNFYAVNTRGQLCKVSHTDWSRKDLTKVPRGAFRGIDDEEYWDYNDLYCSSTPVIVLLESEGRLYLLNKQSKRRYEEDTDMLNIYILDEKAWEWKAVTDLRNRVFFVVTNQTGNEPLAAFSLSAEDLRRDTGNCVYWFNQRGHDCDDWGQRDIWTQWEYSNSSSCFKVKASWDIAISEPLAVKSLRKKAYVRPNIEIV